MLYGMSRKKKKEEGKGLEQHDDQRVAYKKLRYSRRFMHEAQKLGAALKLFLCQLQQTFVRVLHPVLRPVVMLPLCRLLPHALRRSIRSHRIPGSLASTHYSQLASQDLSQPLSALSHCGQSALMLMLSVDLLAPIVSSSSISQPHPYLWFTHCSRRGCSCRLNRMDPS